MPTKSNKNSLQYQLSLVSAPEDFPPELSTLSTLDSTLRCPVCKDFYQAPVIIHIQKCCHTFCSACIRTCFNNNSNNHKIGATGLGGVGNSQRCPICKVEAQEEKIKPVPTLESAVISWQNAREEIFRIIERSQSLESQLNELRSLSSSNSKPIMEEATSKQKKTAHTSSQQQSGKTTSHPEPKTRAQKAKLSAKRKSQDRPTQADDSDDGIEVLDHNPTDPSAPVRCPICSTQMLNAKMDSHLTSCLNEKNRNRSQSSSVPAKKLKTSHQRGTQPVQKRIPLPHFASMKTKDIKTELSKHDLRSDGTSSIQMRRLSRYITLFNANLDANPLHQKSLESLRKALYEWESLQDSENLNLDKNRQKIFSNQTNYLKSNHSQFAQLIDQASKSLKPPPKPVDSLPSDPSTSSLAEAHPPETDSRPSKVVESNSNGNHGELDNNHESPIQKHVALESPDLAPHLESALQENHRPRIDSDTNPEDRQDPNDTEYSTQKAVDNPEDDHNPKLKSNANLEDRPDPNQSEPEDNHHPENESKTSPIPPCNSNIHPQEGSSSTNNLQQSSLKPGDQLSFARSPPLPHPESTAEDHKLPEN
ncbi:uncharacterized protein PGTG_13023 [Puccinia graminis f. sp. tritici CRL 75-36-700-3]|uniref:RING-type domain-containing protein n=1 Tax=Puccinia graminis f. sp. tritici (strain CRL 75-36-700-3 / race SCCL) TaxID=418459 RepID=E3KQR6_PUCGT|nr:uncharacterized protein PGTG_13023 [Puccinia graminis f. sp. tritici CRL 75-36-700-3]EFP86641.1 hypothetical protein PGTG_13023 [Puccinia graminis f. sp. tritici CRL 75-36-700-3]